jgi:hypothetical protein
MSYQCAGDMKNRKKFMAAKSIKEKETFATLQICNSDI